MTVDSNQPSQDPIEPPRRPVGRFAVLGALLLGAVIGGVLVEYWLVRRGVATPSAQTTPGGGDLAAEVAHLRSVLPTQSHTMKDVGDHWVNLWYAVERRNWPLARFFFDQGRQQIRWTLAIRPERVLPGGGTVNVRSLFTPMDMSMFAALQLTIEDEDTEAFSAAYKETLTGCHSCHTAVQMPFLRPTIPTVPPSSSLSFDPEP
jgi:hypothetical protein